MKIVVTVSIGKYQSLKYETSEHNHGDDKLNYYECNKEILSAMEKHFKHIPELEDMVNIFRNIVNEVY